MHLQIIIIDSSFLPVHRDGLTRLQWAWSDWRPLREMMIWWPKRERKGGREKRKEKERKSRIETEWQLLCMIFTSMWVCVIMSSKCKLHGKSKLFIVQQKAQDSLMQFQWYDVMWRLHNVWVILPVLPCCLLCCGYKVVVDIMETNSRLAPLVITQNIFWSASVLTTTCTWWLQATIIQMTMSHNPDVGMWFHAITTSYYILWQPNLGPS